MPMPERDEYSHSYSHTRTPFKTDLCGLPLSTIIATGISATMFTIAIILIMALDCPLDRSVIYFFVFLLIAITSQAIMAGINMMYTRYRFNCLSLSVSLIYSGSAALILFGLIRAMEEGLCTPANSTKVSVFKQGHTGNYFILLITSIGLAFQVVGHYYYG